MNQVVHWIKEWGEVVWNDVAWPQKLAWLGFVLGLVGLGLCIHYEPAMDATLSQVTRWALLYLGATALALSCIPGFRPPERRMNGFHLKVVDLVWVLASSVGAIIAIVQGYQFFAEQDRANYAKYVSESRETAGKLFDIVLARDCGSTTTQLVTGCEQVKSLRTILRTRAQVNVSHLIGACPLPPFNPGRPPAGFSSEQVAGCLQAIYVANTSELEVVKDEENVTTWRHQIFIWSLAMIFFVALRIAKSVAEVVWKVK